MFSDLSQSPLKKNLWRLFLLRSTAIFALCVALALVFRFVNIILPWLELLIVTVTLAILNLLTWLRLRKNWPVSNAEFFVQLMIDVLGLSLLLYYSGGSTNPFVSLYLLPLTITAAVLPWTYTWMMAAITVCCYSLLLFNYIPLPHNHDRHLAEFNIHVIGMWLSFVLSTMIIAWFVVKMSTSIRDRDKDLAQVREQALQNEQIIALGTLAAGTAHELGTPLSTMAVITGELQQEHVNDEEFQHNIRILRDQITQCKQMLTQLLANTGQSRSEDASGLPADLFMQQVLDKWQLIRPSVKFSYQCNGLQPAPQIINTQILSQSILNLLNNAADASSECVEIICNWNNTTLSVEIIDDGTGLSDEVAQRAGEAFFTNKAPGQGFGIGLFLANANIERFGGSVRLFNHERGGACTFITLPFVQNHHDQPITK